MMVHQEGERDGANEPQTFREAENGSNLQQRQRGAAVD